MNVRCSTFFFCWNFPINRPCRVKFAKKGGRIDSPDYLIIGHVSKDKVAAGFALGGTCSYAGLTAHRLGRRTAALTSYGPDIPALSPLMDGVRIANVPHPVSTAFENIYEEGGRRQRWTATAARLTYEQIPPAWRNTPIVHLAPIAQELSPDICRCFKDALLCVTVQGWLRGCDAEGNVFCRPHAELKAPLTGVDILVFGRSDLYDRRAALIPLLTSAGLAVETLGPGGCRLFQHGRAVHIPVKPEIEIDPTGAGDIFAAAFFIRYRETGDAVEAARFANACAALSVRKRGLAGVPDHAAAEEHYRRIYDRIRSG